MIDRRTLGAPRAVLAAVALAVTAVVVLAGCASSSGTRHDSTAAAAQTAKQSAALTAKQSAATIRHAYDPYDSSGTLTVAVARTAKGSCWSTSLADPSTSTYRCFAGNQILDPCFARADTAKGDTVACVADPWSKATVLTLTKSLPSATPTAHRVWAFRRADGARCVAATGTVPEVGGRNLPYNCSDGTFAALNHSSARQVGVVFAPLKAHQLTSSTVRALWTT